MAKYERASQRFKVFGLDLNHPVDATLPGHFPALHNVRSYADGVLEPRQGPTLATTATGIVASQTPVHTIRRLNNPATGTYLRILGVGTRVAKGTTGAYSAVAYGGSTVNFGSEPKAFVPFRPPQSPASWMYIGSSTPAQMRKVDINGAVDHIGQEPPTSAPGVELGTWRSGDQNIDFASTGTNPNQWLNDGTVFTAETITARISTSTGSTITDRVYDSGTYGWCGLVVPEAVAAMVGVGAHVWDGTSSSEYVVHQTLPGANPATALTVSSIMYQSFPTLTGNCIIQPSAAVPEIKRNSIVYLNSTVYARVTAIIRGQDDSFSFQCNTGASTISAGNSIVVMPVLRVYDDNPGSISAGDYIADYSPRAAGAVQVSGSAAGTGWVQMFPATTMDMTRFTAGASSTGEVTDDDWIHLSFMASDLSKISQCRIMLDCNTKLNISAVANTTPIQITTTTNHDLQTGDKVHIQGAAIAGANGWFTVTQISATVFSLDGTAAGGVGGAAGTVLPRPFQMNFYYRAFYPNDLTAAAKGIETALDTRGTEIERKQLYGNPVGEKYLTKPISYFADDPAKFFEQEEFEEGAEPKTPNSPPSSQTGTGDYQWHEITFRRREFERVGIAKTGWAAINGIRLEVTFTDDAAGTTQIVRLNSFTVYGGSPLETEELALPYSYRYRYRVSTTGARSNWSPASRLGILTRRASVAVDVPAGLNDADKIDIQRWGGTNTQWLDVGSIDTGLSTDFVDEMSDAYARGSAAIAEDDTNFQPWVVVGTPVATYTSASGTSTNSGVGSYIQVGATGLPANLAKGTPLKVNGINTFFRGVIAAASSTASGMYEVEDSLGTLPHGTTVEIPAPLIQFTSLPALWAHDQRLYAVGDTTNPGRLYYTNYGDPDSTTPQNICDVTTPSEALMNGCSYNGRNYVWSSDRMFELQDTGDRVVAVEVPGGKGLYCRWALAVGERIWFVGKDGIYQTGGGECVSITDETLKPLFVKEGNQGITVGSVVAPDWTQTSKIKLSYYDGYLYFIYQDTGGVLRCLTYSLHTEKPGWWYDYYTGADGMPNGLSCIYGEEGSGIHSLLAGGNDTTTARLYQINGPTDNVAAIPCQVDLPAFGAGDLRSEKIFGDAIVDANTQGKSVTVAALINNYSTTAVTISPTVLSTSTNGRTQTIINSSSGEGIEARNLALRFTWNSTSTSEPALFGWEPSWLPRPEDTTIRATDYETYGTPGPKRVTGFYIHADTAGVDKTVKIEYRTENGTLGSVDLTVNHAVKSTKYYPITTPFVAMVLRLRPTDADTWKLFDDENTRPEFEPYPPLGPYRPDLSDLGDMRDKFMQGFRLEADTTDLSGVAQSITLTVENEDGALENFTINHSGREIKHYALADAVIVRAIRAQTSGNIRVWKIEWIYEPEPGQGVRWETQQTSHGHHGFIHLKAAYVSLMSTASVNLHIIRGEDTSTGTNYTIPTTSGLRQTVYVPFGVHKGKSFIYTFTVTSTSNGFRLYKDTTAVLVKPWGSNEAFANRNMFGDTHGDGKARI